MKLNSLRFLECLACQGCHSAIGGNGGQDEGSFIKYFISALWALKSTTEGVGVGLKAVGTSGKQKSSHNGERLTAGYKGVDESRPQKRRKELLWGEQKTSRKPLTRSWHEQEQQRHLNWFEPQWKDGQP